MKTGQTSSTRKPFIGLPTEKPLTCFPQACAKQDIFLLNRSITIFLHPSLNIAKFRRHFGINELAVHLKDYLGCSATHIRLARPPALKEKH